MTQAVGRLIDASSGKDLGTVFAATRSLGITCYHCVSNSDGHINRVRCQWSIGANEASVSDFDTSNDVALLAFDRTLPRRLDPIGLTANTPAHEEFVAPGAPGELRQLPLVAMSGQIIWPKGYLPNRAPAIQLACRESAAGLSLHGLSGAPVLTGDMQKAVGVIRWNPPSSDNPDLAAGSIVYAAPSSRILEIWPQLRRGIDLITLVDRLADRSRQRGSRAISADIRALLASGSPGIDDDDISNLSSDPSDFSLIALDAGRTVIRVVRRFDVPTAMAVAERELGEAALARSAQTGQRYVAILTDGLQWRLYQLLNRELYLVDESSVDQRAPEDICSWLEAILATGRDISPTQYEVDKKLGAGSPSHKLDMAELSTIYETNRNVPTVKVKRRMWAKLLTTASGVSFEDSDSLFIAHTLLVAMAKLIGHAVLRIPIDDPNITARVLMSGEQLTENGIRGVIEEDFFDWIIEVPEGDRFLLNLAHRLARFDWGHVYRDVMKHLYESIIPRATRHQLGEYYTPDWLAEEILSEAVNDPLNQRVLDASCGSGTFLFHAVHAYLLAADTACRTNAEAIKGVVQHVVGIDVHPVAVTLARVTYLLAIGSERLAIKERPNLSVPVYLGDSMRWGQEADLTLDEYTGLSIPTALDPESFVTGPSPLGWRAFESQLNFPDRVVADAERFDELVAVLADLAAERNGPRSEALLSSIFDRFGVFEDDREELKQTFRRMCELHDQDLDHIWGYYVRNVARPAWLTRSGNRVNVLVGNPPWLVQRHMTKAQQASFRAMSVRRGLWAGGTLATNQDLAGLFVSRCIELYLRPGGRFCYVMPQSVLASEGDDAGTYAGFRKGRFATPEGTLNLAFDEGWDLSDVKPAFFPMPASVIGGRRLNGRQKAASLPRARWEWSGRFDTEYASWPSARSFITRSRWEGSPTVSVDASPYKASFLQGANFVPYFLFNVETAETGRWGRDSSQVRVSSRRSANEKMPWKVCDPISGMVEREFIRGLYNGESILPFRCLSPKSRVVVPWDGFNLLDDGSQLEMHPGLARWWRKAEDSWNRFRKDDTIDLIDQLNYRGKLSRQLSINGDRVVYGGSGMYMAAAVVSEDHAIIEHQLYWGLAGSLDEARYLTAILNSTVVTTAIRRMQRRGEHNPRHVGKKVFSLPIPLFDSADASHSQLVVLARRAEHVASEIELPRVRFEMQRKRIREALSADGVMNDIDEIVRGILKSSPHR